MAAPPRAAPAIIDNTTVYRVFIMTLSIARRTPAFEACLRSCFAHVRRAIETRRLQPLAVTMDTHIDDPGDIVFRHACKLGLEGIVSKRLGSPFRAGRSRHGGKSKNPAAPAVKRGGEKGWGRGKGASGGVDLRVD